MKSNEHTALDQTEGTYLNGNTDRASVLVMARDVRIKRTTGPTHGGGGRRGPVKALSAASHRALKTHLRNATCYKLFVTLTFPNQMLDGRMTKLLLNRFASWARRRGFSFLWALEFGQEGRPHYHLLLTDSLPDEEIRRAWSKCCGAPAVIHCKCITNYSRLSAYVAKTLNSSCHQVPNDFVNVGRFWGTIGPNARPTVLAEFEGTAKEMAPLVRGLMKIQRTKGRPGKKLRDRGVSGMRLRECGGQQVANDLLRLKKYRSGT